KDIPDDIHERTLRLELAAAPYDMELARSLVAVLHRLDRPPMPEVETVAAGRKPPPGDIDALVASANSHACAGDLFRQLAALWQACVRYRDDARGFAEYARAFAERYEWANCRLAVQRAFAMAADPGPQAADALLAALSLLAERGQLADLDWKPWFER